MRTCKYSKCKKPFSPNKKEKRRQEYCCDSCQSKAYALKKKKKEDKKQEIKTKLDGKAVDTSTSSPTRSKKNVVFDRATTCCKHEPFGEIICALYEESFGRDCYDGSGGCFVDPNTIKEKRLFYPPMFDSTAISRGKKIF